MYLLGVAIFVFLRKSTFHFKHIFSFGISKTLTPLLYSSFNGFTTFLTTRFCNNFYFSQSSSSVTTPLRLLWCLPSQGFSTFSSSWLFIGRRTTRLVLRVRRSLLKVTTTLLTQKWIKDTLHCLLIGSVCIKLPKPWCWPIIGKNNRNNESSSTSFINFILFEDSFSAHLWL